MQKLIRDNIPTIIQDHGLAPNTQILSDDEAYLSALHEKLLEEAAEFIEASHMANDAHIQEELADILEVIDALCTLKGYDKAKIEQIKQKKRLKKGGFDKRILLISTDS